MMKSINLNYAAPTDFFTEAFNRFRDKKCIFLTARTGSDFREKYLFFSENAVLPASQRMTFFREVRFWEKC